MSTGIISQIEVKPSYGLSGDEIQSMLAESIDNADKDMQMRFYQEAVVDAKALIDSIEKAIIQDSDLLLDGEMDKISHVSMQLKVKIARIVDDYTEATTQIKTLTNQLNDVSNDFASRRMNQAISASLKGKNVSQVLTENE
jgi:molecular chaperone HscA